MMMFSCIPYYYETIYINKNEIQSAYNFIDETLKRVGNISLTK